MKKWDKYRYDKFRQMAQECDFILDFGQSARGDKKFFSENQYKTADIDPSIQPDILTDICDMHMIKDEEFDGIICCAILEHVYNPFAAVSEMRRILKPGGKLFGYVPFLFPYHPKPGHYSDYYRFSEEGIKYLFRDFRSIEICPFRGNVTTLANMLPGKLNRLQNLFGWLDPLFSNKQVSGYNFFAIR